MGYCEDFPCCGHEQGCCPDSDEDGKQLNMICTCGAKLPVNSRYSICDRCMNRDNYENEGLYGGDRDFVDEPDVDEVQEWHDFDPDC